MAHLDSSLFVKRLLLLVFMIFSPHYDIFKTKLVTMRKAAGLTQRQLAKRLKREHSFVSRIELGERRLDVVEFYWVCRACDQLPKLIYHKLLKEFAKLD
jgi:transcriptional regulator with XRE-family HTH domain